MASEALHPTYTGFIETTYDALIVINLCRLRQLDYVHARVGEADRERLIRSGSVFVFDENAAGIKRWTDGLTWSPSRICNNFLVYRNGRGRGRAQREADYDDDGARIKASGPKRRMVSRGEVTSPYHAREREILGSLTDDSRFKEGGLCKRTISVGSIHLVSYFRLADVVPLNRLPTPSTQRELEAFALDPALLEPEHFRVAPIVEVDASGILRYRGEGRQPGLLSPMTNQPMGLPADDSSPVDETTSFDFSVVPLASTTATSSSGTRSTGMASPGADVFEKALTSPMPPHAGIPIPGPNGQYRLPDFSHGTVSAPSSCASSPCSGLTDGADMFPPRQTVSADGVPPLPARPGLTVDYRPRANSVSIYDSVLFGSRPPMPAPQHSYEGRPHHSPRMSPYSRCDVLPPAAPINRPALRHYNFGQQSPPAYDTPNYAAVPSREPPRPEAYPRYVAPTFPHDFGSYSLGGTGGSSSLSALPLASSSQSPPLVSHSPPLPSHQPGGLVQASGLVGAAPSPALIERTVARPPAPHFSSIAAALPPLGSLSPAPAPLFRHERYSPSTEWQRMI